jgi:hypothetical protein
MAILRRCTTPSGNQQVKELGERFLNQYVAVRCKPSTQAEYRRSVELFLDPFFRQATPSPVATADVAEFHGFLSHIPRPGIGDGPFMIPDRRTGWRTTKPETISMNHPHGAPAV